MFPIYPTYGFAYGHPSSCVSKDNVPGSYAQDYFGGFPGGFGGWYPHAYEHQVDPWAQQWRRETGIRQGPFTLHSNTATITQPRGQPTYGVDQAPQAFSRVAGGPTPTTRLGLVCPRPIYPLPTWINVAMWENVEEGLPDPTSNPADDDNHVVWKGGEDYDNEFGVPRRFLPSFILSPDPEDLPVPFFPSRDSSPSLCTLASLSPDARDLPQPRFDSDPWLTVPGFISHHSSRYDSFESTVFPDSGDLPPPNFEAYSQIKIGGFGQPDLRRDCTEESLWLCRAGRGIAESRDKRREAGTQSQLLPEAVGFDLRQVKSP